MSDWSSDVCSSDLPGAGGKIDPAALEAALGQGWSGVQHHPQPAAVSLTQATESGTVYSPDEVAQFAHLCRANGMHLHMDGARFANAVAGMNVSPAALTRSEEHTSALQSPM